MDARTVIVRSAQVRPVVLHRFHDPHKDLVRSIIRNFKAGKRREAIRVWTTFVDGLVEYREPVDLDEIMMYIARESCLHENDAVLLHSLKLEYLEDSADRLGDFIDQLEKQRDACTHGLRPCAPKTVARLGSEIIQARADLKVLAIEKHAANEEFDASMHALQGGGAHFTAVFDDMFKEVEVRVRITP